MDTIRITKMGTLTVALILFMSAALFALQVSAQEVPTGTLTLKKAVVNDGGGTAVETDWTLFATGPVSISGVNGSSSITAAAVPVGVYSLSESDGPAQYTASSWACNASLVNPFTVAVSENELTTCTITNYFVPPPPQCSDRKDNDGDELTDFESDPECTSATDDSEAVEVIEESIVCDGGFHLEESECVPDEIADTGSSRPGSHRRGGGGGGGEVLGATTCAPLLTDYLHIGFQNDSNQVTKLQEFLNTNLALALPVNGVFGSETLGAVKQFQVKYAQDILKPWLGLPASGIDNENDATGYVYQTTRWKINTLWCEGSEAFPDTLI